MADVAWLCARTEDADATRRLAQRLAAHMASGDLMVLTGDLGAGKTCFTQGLGLGLGVEGRITSPTFTLVAEHQGRLPLHHLDVYRLDQPDDAYDLDLPELLEFGVTVIEWGERIDEILPADRATVEIRFDEPDNPDDPDNPDRRLLRLELRGTAWVERADVLARAIDQWAEPC